MFKCYNCEVELSSLLFCETCELMQAEAVRVDYFTLFGLSDNDVPDNKVLSKTLRSLSRQVHPDFFPKAQKLAEELSSFINQAYKTLSDTSSRLEYLLLLKGGLSASDDKSTANSFLMEMMEFQERIEDELSGDSKTQLETEITAIQESCLQKAQQHIASQDLKAARLSLNEASYCRRLMKNLRGEYEGQ